MFFVLHSLDGYYAGSHPTGRVRTVPTLEGAVILGREKLSAIPPTMCNFEAIELVEGMHLRPNHMV